MTEAAAAISPERRQAQGHRAMALGWLKRDRYRQAIISFEKALATDPTYLEAYLELTKVLLSMRRWQDLAALSRRGLKYHMALPELHKMLITALEELGTLDDAFACYGLERRDDRCIAIAPEEILCCLVARNERPRLPYFLEYYRKLGVDRFFVIDNGSTDGSVGWLLDQADVHVWYSELSFKRANFGSSWFELLLRRYGVGHWCLTMDADEFLIYEGAPERSLRQFCQDLERRGKRIATGILLDLYGDGSIHETVYREGTNPLSLCSYFDRNFYHTLYKEGEPYHNQDIFFGGVRQRIFPTEHNYLLNKSLLVRYQPDVVLSSGQHLTNIPSSQQAVMEICVLHFKFFASFIHYAEEEARREMHALGGFQYKAYHQKLVEEENLVLYDPQHSVKFEGTRQLLELGIMRAGEAIPEPDIPAIAPIHIKDSERPFWSVMVSIFDRVQNVEPVLARVLRQADESMQIEVVSDFSNAELQAAIAAEVARVGGGRVSFFPLPEPTGHPQVFNRCIERARGLWVHILHDDDWVEPGFYKALRKGIESAPDVGAAFCQHSVVTREGDETSIWPSWVERETPGVIDDWLSRIALECRVQFSAMVVRREVYETVGGFCPAASSAFDWEMWIRIAVRYRVFYEPENLVGVGRDGTAESTRLMRSGEQIRHAFAALEVAARQLPVDQAGQLVAKGRERMAGYALEVARKFKEAGDAEAVLANLRAAVSDRASPRTLQRISDFLRGEDHDFRG